MIPFISSLHDIISIGAFIIQLQSIIFSTNLKNLSLSLLNLGISLNSTTRPVMSLLNCRLVLIAKLRHLVAEVQMSVTFLKLLGRVKHVSDGFILA